MKGAKRISLYAILTLFLPAALGCIPATFSGYLPSGPGTVEGRYCGGLGVKDVLRVQADADVRIEIRAGQNMRNNSITLDVSMTVPAGVTLQLLSPEFVVQSREWPTPRLLPIDRIMGSGPKPGPNRYSPTDKLTGALGAPGLFGFWFLKGDKGTLFETNIPRTDSFRLQFPTMSINGQTYRLEPIDFEAYEKLSVYTCVQ